jgi:tyrosyl-tRNA synthetase
MDLILKHISEIVDPENQIEKKLLDGNLNIYWGTAPTGLPHLGYLVPLIKIGHFLKAGCHVTILFADLHAMLDNMKSTPELIQSRTQYYKFIITEILMHLGISIDKLTFVIGSDFQLQKDYQFDVLKLSAMNSVRSTQHAGAEVVKQSKNPQLSTLIYPIMQALDEVYLHADVQFGGVDQRKIFMFARENLPKLGYKVRSHLMNPLIPGLTKSGKMSSSEPLSKIDFNDDDETIRLKLNKSFSIDTQIQGNGLMAIIKYILFEIYPQGFTVDRPQKYGGPVSYDSYDQLENDFIQGQMASVDLKPTVAQLIIDWIQPLRHKINDHQDLLHQAYPGL